MKIDYTTPEEIQKTANLLFGRCPEGKKLFLATQVIGDYNTWGEVERWGNAFGFIEGSEEVIECDFCDGGTV